MGECWYCYCHFYICLRLLLSLYRVINATHLSVTTFYSELGILLSYIGHLVASWYCWYTAVCVISVCSVICVHFKSSIILLFYWNCICISIQLCIIKKIFELELKILVLYIVNVFDNAFPNNVFQRQWNRLDQRLKRESES